MLYMNCFEKQHSEKNTEKAKFTYLGSEKDAGIHEIKKLFGVIILMRIIYKTNILTHWSTDRYSLYYTPIFHKL